YSPVTPLAAPTPAPAVPVVTAAARLDEVSIKVDWTDANTDETGYKVERCEKPDPATCTDADFSLVTNGTKGQNIYTHTDTTVKANTTYTYRVRAYKTVAGGCSWESVSTTNKSATTTITPPSGLAKTV